MNRRGFTLLEVLVALAILAIAGIALLRVGMVRSQHLNHLQIRTVASWVADNTLARLQLKSGMPKASQGQVSMSHRQWFYKIIVGKPNRWLQPYKVEVRAKSDGPVLVSRTAYIQLQGEG